ncbi:MAG: septum formation initiator family protein [bacterium]|nr:septum formation initiator family protein [bacterium]MBU1918855.1 septum formation initiator family protein [bacterium]
MTRKRKKRIKGSHRLNLTFNNILYCATFLVFVSFFAVTVWGRGGLLELKSLTDKRDTVGRTNQMLLKQNLFFLEEIHELQKLSYVEQRARTDLSLVRDDEIVFVVEKED